MFEIWDENGYANGLTLQALKMRLSDYQGDSMVRYCNKLGLPTTLFLTVRAGVSYQRFKAGSPRLNWEWLAEAANGHVPRHFNCEHYLQCQLSHIN